MHNHSYFLITDIHGMYSELLDLLAHWDAENETLVIMGDMIDRGDHSKDVLLHLYELSEQHDVKLIRGNHEELFMAFLTSPDDFSAMYYGAGGRNTLNSFFGKESDTKTPDYLAGRFHKEYPHLVKWLASAVPYIEVVSGDWTNVFVHAGVDLALEDWRDTPDSDFAWIRREFAFADNAHKNTRFFFGHTPTYLLNADQSHDPFISEDRKVGIDGGGWVSKCLYGAKVRGDHYSIISNTHSTHQKVHV